MHILSLSLDGSILDPSSASAERQCAYFEHDEAEIIVLQPGATREVVLSPTVHVRSFGGANKAVALWRAMRRVRSIARGTWWDVVTVQDPLWCGLVAWLAMPRWVPVHVQDHSGLFERGPFTWAERLLFPFAKFFARRAARIRTVSQRGKRGLLRIGIPEDRIDVIPIATDVSRFAAVPDPVFDSMRALCVARLEPEKGVDVLLRAWKRVTEKHPDARLRIVGDGSERSKLERLCSRIGIASSVEWRGRGKDIPAELAWSNIYVQPSYFEGWGLAVIEAAAAGRPVVMTDVGCAGEVIKDGEQGRVVEVGDAAEMAEAVTGMWKDGEAMRAMTERARDASRRRSGERAAPTAPAESILRAIKQKKESSDRVLIVVQACDEEDAFYGFFTGWLRTFSQYGEAIVCALRVGSPLPDVGRGIEVHALRARGSRSKWEVVIRLAALSWRERFRYGSVFVRGDAVYIVLFWWLWKLLGKKIIFWYAHYKVTSTLFWIASFFADRIVTSVPEANPHPDAIPIGQSVDTDVFFPEPEAMELSRPRVLMLGRVSAVKRVAWAAAAMKEVLVHTGSDLAIYGRPLVASAREELLAVLGDRASVWSQDDVSRRDAVGLYRSAAVFVNATPGSLDKTIIEAAACGTVVIATSEGYRRELPEDLRWLWVTTEEELAGALARVLALSASQRRAIGERLRDVVCHRHSERHQIEMLLPFFRAHPRRTLRMWVRHSLLRMIPDLSIPGIRVLMLHAMDGRGVGAWDADRLSEMVQYLRARGYSFCRLSELWDGKRWLIPEEDSRRVLLTFDDATEDFKEVEKVLSALDVGVVVCAPSGITRLTTSDGISRRVLSGEELLALYKGSHVELAGHGMRHVHLTECTPDDLRTELEESREWLLGALRIPRPLVMAYPRGRHDRSVRLAARDYGFDGGWTVEPGIWNAVTDAYAIPRIPLLAGMDAADVLKECEGRGERLRAMRRFVG